MLQYENDIASINEIEEKLVTNIKNYELLLQDLLLPFEKFKQEIKKNRQKNV